MDEEGYVIIKPENFHHQFGPGEIDAINWKMLEIPAELKILEGYRRPRYSEIDGGFPEFLDWIKRTKTEDRKVIVDSVRFLELKIAYYDWLEHIDDYLSEDDRIHSRLEKGLDELELTLN